MADPRLPDAVALSRAGQKHAARQLLLQILRDNPQEETAWLWLADTAGNPTERMQVLREGLRRLPESRVLAHGLAVLESQVLSQPEPEPEVQAPAAAPAPLPPEPPVDGLADTSPPQTPKPPPTLEESLRAESHQAMAAADAVDEARRPLAQRRILRFAIILLVLLVAGAIIFFAIKPGGWLSLIQPAPTATPTQADAEPTDEPEAPTPTAFGAATPAPTPTPLSFSALRLPETLEPIAITNVKRLSQVAALSHPYGIFSPDWQTFAAANQNSVNIWDVPTGRLLHAFSGHIDTIWSLDFSPDGTRIASGSLDRSLIIWDLVEDELSLGLSLEPSLALESYFLGNFGPRGFDVEFSPDGEIIAGGLTDAIALWDAETGARTGVFTADLGGEMLTFSPRGDFLFDAAPGYISQIDVETGQVVATFEGRGKSFPVPPGFAVSPDGRTLAVEVDGIVDTVELALFDLRANAYLRSLTGLRATIDRVAFSPDGTLVAGGGSEGKILIWNAVSGALLQTLPAGTVSTLEFSPDARLLRNGDQLWGVLPPGAVPPVISGKPVQLTSDFERVTHAQAPGYGSSALSQVADGFIFLSSTLEGAQASQIDAAGAASSFGSIFTLTGLNTPVSIDNRLLFAAPDLQSRRMGLYALDAGAGTAGLVHVFRGGEVTDHQPAAAAKVAGQALFALASREAIAIFIFASDGTAAGTRLVSEIAGQDVVVDSLVWQEQWYLVLEDSTQLRRSLWRSDGSAAGLTKLADLPQGAPNLPPDRLAAWGDSLALLHFSANGSGLWRSDGTPAGTTQVSPLLSSAESFPVRVITSLGSDLLFLVADPAGEVRLYAVGSTGGPRLLARQPGELPGAVTPPLVVMSARVYWMLLTPEGGAVLYAGDASGAAPLAVAEYPPSPRNPGVGQLAVLDGILFFTAPDEQVGWSLWQTDGNPARTRQVLPNRAFDLLPAGNALFFAVDQPTSYTGLTTTLWKYVP